MQPGIVELATQGKRRFKLACDSGRDSQLVLVCLQLAALRLLIDILLDRLGRNIARRANVGSGMPEMALAHSAFQNWEALEQATSRDTFENLDDHGGRNFRRRADKTVNVIRHRFYGHQFKPVISARLLKDFLQGRLLWPIKNRAAILRYPDQVVGDEVKSMSGSFRFHSADGNRLSALCVLNTAFL